MSTASDRFIIEEILSRIYDHASTNIPQCDHMLCEYCNKPIEFKEDRSNRVDCDKGKRFHYYETYHLACYYDILFHDNYKYEF